MQTDTHAALLAELPKEFVPEWISMRGVHAPVYIERAAWKRVREWCQSQGLMMHVDDDDDHPSIYCGPASKPRLLGTGPDDATALLAACRFINEQEKR